MNEKVGITNEPTWNEGFSLIAKGMGIFMHKINKSIHRFPYAYMVIIIASSVILSCWKIGEARSERDSINHTNYLLTQQVDSMKNLCLK